MCYNWEFVRKSGENLPLPYQIKNLYLSINPLTKSVYKQNIQKKRIQED